MMRLGISSYTFVWSIGVPGYPPPPQPLSPLGLLERAEELGVRVVQFADHLSLDRLTATELAAVVSRARQCGIELELGTMGIDPAHLRRQLELAVSTGARLVRTVTDTPDHHPTPQEAVTLLAEVAGEFSLAGVTLALENHDRFKAATLRQIVDDVASPHLGICLDTANSLGASEGPATVLETLGPRTCCLHVKDYTARRLPHRFGFLIEGAPAGAGDLDIPRWLDRLRELKRDANVILELWPAPEATIGAAIAKENAWAAQSIRHLRQFITD